MLKTFRGGVHPNDMKAPTAGKSIVELDPSPEMVYPMTQHIGALQSLLLRLGNRFMRGKRLPKQEVLCRLQFILRFPEPSRRLKSVCIPTA